MPGASGVPGAVPGASGVPGAVPGASGVPGAVPGASGVPESSVPGSSVSGSSGSSGQNGADKDLYKYQSPLRILVPSQYIDVFVLGKYGGESALVTKQKSKQMMWEDDFYDNSESFLPKNLTRPKVGDFKINLIKFNSGSSVGNWNMGGEQCVEVTGTNPFELCNKHQEKYGNKFSYTLVTQIDWDNANRSIEARKQAIERGKKKEEEDKKKAEEAEKQRKIKEEEDKKKAEEASKSSVVPVDNQPDGNDTNNLLIERQKSNQYLSIGDSQTYHLSNNSTKFKTLKNNTGSSPGDPKYLHKGGWTSTQLIESLKAISKYQYPNMRAIAIVIGTNDGYNNSIAKQNAPTLKDLLKNIFPNAKLIVVPGSWGWGGLKGIQSYEKGDATHASPKSYYDIYGKYFTILDVPIGNHEPHNSGLQSYKDINKSLNKY